MSEQQTTQVMLVVDWGGTWCRVALVDRMGEILWQDRRPNPRDANSSQYLGLADTLLAEALAVKGLRVGGIGIAVAGPVDTESGILYQPPNLMALDGVSLKTIWGEKYRLPVALGNDANLAAVGEYHFGAGRDAAQAGHPRQSVFYVTVSTGIGGGLVEGGSLLLGANGLTAEVGHTTIDTSDAAPLCQCGRLGCLEAVSSGTAIANHARAALANGKHTESTLSAVSPAELSAESVVSAALQGDELANDLMYRAVHGLAIGLSNAVHMFNPDLIILGGGVSEGFRQLDLFPRIKREIQSRLMSELHKAFDLVPSALGDNSGLLGAAAAVWELADGS